MSTPPIPPEPSVAPDNGTASSTAKSAVAPKVLFAALYPALAGIALRYIAVFGAFAALPDGETGFAVSMALVALLVISGVHLWCKRTLEEYDEPRPWQFPTVLSTAMAAGVSVSAYAFATGLGFLLHPAVVCTAFCLLGAFLFTLVTERRRLLAALGSVLAVSVLLASAVWLFHELRLAAERDDLVQEAVAVEYPIAVLDDPDWEPTSMSFHQSTDIASISFELADPSRETEGFELMLESRSVHDLTDTSLYAQCESDPGGDGCAEHGDIVMADNSGRRDDLQAATEFTDGYVAELSTNMPTDERGNAQAEEPDIDMVELAGQIRAAEPGEAEEIAEQSD